MNTTEYQDPTKNSNGGMSLYCRNTVTKRNPKFELAKCRAPFGISLTDQNGVPVVGRKNMELSLDDPALLAFVQEWDRQNVQIAADNSTKWFGKKLSAQSLGDTLYRHSAQPHKEGKYAPTLRVKIVPKDPTKTGKRDNSTKIYIVVKGPDGKEKWRRGTMDEVTRNSQVLPIVEFSGLWFVAKGFGGSWTATSILVWPGEEDEDEFPFEATMDKATEDDPPAAKRQRTNDYGGAAAAASDYGEYGAKEGFE